MRDMAKLRGNCCLQFTRLLFPIMSYQDAKRRQILRLDGLSSGPVSTYILPWLQTIVTDSKTC
jgi:hypothetical protein